MLKWKFSFNLVLFPLAARKCKTIKAMASPTVSAPKREKDPKKRVVITGMGLVSVFGSDIDTFYNKLLEGESGISLIDRFDASSYTVRFGGQIRNFSSVGYIDGKNDRRLDDCWRYCLVAGKRALENANLGPQVLESVSDFVLAMQCGLKNHFTFKHFRLSYTFFVFLFFVCCTDGQIENRGIGWIGHGRLVGFHYWG